MVELIMRLITVECDYCHNLFDRSSRRINEAIKKNWRQFCSINCQSLAKQGRPNIYICKTCGSNITRTKQSIASSGNIFCSQHCFAKYNNMHRITRLTIAKKERMLHRPICKNINCQKQIGLENKLFCSPKCRFETYKKYNIDYVERNIKNFVRKTGRIPTKNEISSLNSKARRVFGSWNKAIESSGFIPNTVKFSRKYISNDGHRCDSLSEKIVDDWLFARKIPHQVKVKYPWNNGMSADFKVGDKWIELFGLSGQLESYDRLMKIKLKNIKIYKLNLISLYLCDIFPHNRLEEKLSSCKKT